MERTSKKAYQIAKRLAAESTVSPADTKAALTALGSVMGDYMAQGRSVKLDGIGTFYVTATVSKNSVDNKEEVAANQINGVHVCFVPKTNFHRASDMRVATRTLTDTTIC